MEGAITAERIYQTAYNNGVFSTPSKTLLAFLANNTAWMQANIASARSLPAGNPTRVYWRHVDLILRQMAGMSAGYDTTTIGLFEICLIPPLFTPTLCFCVSVYPCLPDRLALHIVCPLFRQCSLALSALGAANVFSVARGRYGGSAAGQWRAGAQSDPGEWPLQRVSAPDGEQRRPLHLAGWRRRAMLAPFAAFVCFGLSFS